MGYPSGQDNTSLPAWDHSLCPARKQTVFFSIYNKSFIDQDCLVKMSG